MLRISKRHLNRKFLGAPGVASIAVVNCLFVLSCQSKKTAIHATSESSLADEKKPGTEKAKVENNLEKNAKSADTASTSEVKTTMNVDQKAGAWTGVGDIRNTVSRKLLLSNLAVSEQLILLGAGSNSEGNSLTSVKSSQSSGAKIAFQRRFEASNPFKFQVAQSNDDMAFAVHDKFPSYRHGAALCGSKDEFFSFTPPMDGNGKFFEKSKPTRIYASGLSSLEGEKSQLIWRKEKTHKWEALSNLIVSSDCNTLAFVASDPDTKLFSIVALKRPRVELLGDGSRAPWDEMVVSGRGLAVAAETLSQHFAFVSRIAGEDLNVALLAKTADGQKIPAFFEIRKSKNASIMSPKDLQKFFNSSEVKQSKECSGPTKDSLKITSSEIHYISGSSICSFDTAANSASLKQVTKIEKFSIESFDIARRQDKSLVLALVVSPSVTMKPTATGTIQGSEDSSLDSAPIQGMILASQTVVSSKGAETLEKEPKTATWKLSLIDEWKYLAQLGVHHQVHPKFLKQGALLVYARPNLPEVTKADIEAISSSSEFPIELIQVEPVPQE